MDTKKYGYNHCLENKEKRRKEKKEKSKRYIIEWKIMIIFFTNMMWLQINRKILRKCNSLCEFKIEKKYRYLS